LSSCFVLSLEALIFRSISGSRRQLSVSNHKGHGGSDAPDTPLLAELEGGACWQGDVVMGGKEGDQGDHDAAQGLEPSLAIENSVGGCLCP
jgi:hypothetical protein